ncbi:MAG: hypothetical protein L6W00_30680 [Lentisphaeria bacterium]|nr:MAG: hypothetical protein L6W00_30680 [Lentisphaeria bacterium]
MTTTLKFSDAVIAAGTILNFLQCQRNKIKDCNGREICQNPNCLALIDMIRATKGWNILKLDDAQRLDYEKYLRNWLLQSANQTNNIDVADESELIRRSYQVPQVELADWNIVENYMNLEYSSIFPIATIRNLCHKSNNIFQISIDKKTEVKHFLLLTEYESKGKQGMMIIHLLNSNPKKKHDLVSFPFFLQASREMIDSTNAVRAFLNFLDLFGIAIQIRGNTLNRKFWFSYSAPTKSIGKDIQKIFSFNCPKDTNFFINMMTKQTLDTLNISFLYAVNTTKYMQYLHTSNLI